MKQKLRLAAGRELSLPSLRGTIVGVGLPLHIFSLTGSWNHLRLGMIFATKRAGWCAVGQLLNSGG